MRDRGQEYEEEWRSVSQQYCDRVLIKAPWIGPILPVQNLHVLKGLFPLGKRSPTYRA